MNRKRTIFYAVLVLIAAMFNASTQIAMANDNPEQKTFVGNSAVITNTGGLKYIVGASLSGPFSSLTNSVISTDDGSGFSRVLVQKAATNDIGYADSSASIEWPKGATVTYFASGPSTETNRYWLLTVSNRPE